MLEDNGLELGAFESRPETDAINSTHRSFTLLGPVDAMLLPMLLAGTVRTLGKEAKPRG